jgi:hypothetical protein
MMAGTRNDKAACFGKKWLLALTMNSLDLGHSDYEYQCTREAPANELKALFFRKKIACV